MRDHTPGPWMCVTAEDYRVIGADFDFVCGVFGRNDDRVIPDLKMIVAAPLMLAALKRQQENIRRWLETGVPAGPEESKEISDQIDAAILAAEG